MTVEAIGADLKRGDFLFRYVVADDFGQPGDRLHDLHVLVHRRPGRAGRREEARALFETLLAWRNQLGLLSEDIAIRDRRAVGQLPADLFAGRPHQLRDEAQQELGGGFVSRLVVVSNRVTCRARAHASAPAGLRSPSARRWGAAAACGSAGAASSTKRRRRPRSRQQGQDGLTPSSTSRRGVRRLLQRVRQLDAVAAVPLPARPGRSSIARRFQTYRAVNGRFAELLIPYLRDDDRSGSTTTTCWRWRASCASAASPTASASSCTSRCRGSIRSRCCPASTR